MLRKERVYTTKTFETDWQTIGYRELDLDCSGNDSGTLMGYLLVFYLATIRSANVFEGIRIELKFSWSWDSYLMIITVVALMLIITVYRAHKINIADVERDRTA